MTRGRRAILLAGLALLLGALAASDVAGRESAMRDELGTPVAVVVAATDVRAGARIDPGSLAVRQIPARYAPSTPYTSPGQLAGLRAAVAIPRGTVLQPALADDGSDRPRGPDLRRGERIGEVVATGDPSLVVAGGRVDVLVTRERGSGGGTTTLALEDVEVLSSSAAPAARDDDSATPKVRVALRVSVRQAIALTAAQAFAREVRILPRGSGDDERGLQGLAVGDQG